MVRVEEEIDTNTHMEGSVAVVTIMDEETIMEEETMVVVAITGVVAATTTAVEIMMAVQVIVETTIEVVTIVEIIQRTSSRTATKATNLHISSNFSNSNSR